MTKKDGAKASDQKSGSEILSLNTLFSCISFPADFFRVQRVLRSQTRFLSEKRTKDAHCFGQLPDHLSHYQVLPTSATHSLEIQGKNPLKKSRVQKERKEEIKFFPLPELVLFGWWTAKQLPNKLCLMKAERETSPAHQQLSLMPRWNSWQGEGNSTGVNKSWRRNSLPFRPPGASAGAGTTLSVLPNTWENHYIFVLLLGYS